MRSCRLLECKSRQIREDGRARPASPAVAGPEIVDQVFGCLTQPASPSPVLLAPPARGRDGRTTALMDQSIRFMERLALWEKIAPSAAALSTMRIIDGTNRLLRAPAVSFRSPEVGLEAFGYNIPNATLLSALAEAVAQEGNITHIPHAATGITLRQNAAEIMLEGGESISAAFVTGADGRKSRVRDSAGIGVRHWSYPQTAIVLNFGHSLPHGNISTEFHTESGPFTQVPLPGNRSSLVWVRKPAEAEELMALSPEALGLRIEHQMQSMLGKVTVEPDVQAWPLSGMMANRFGKGRLALVGEAGHVFPPIGAQGFNLSLRDIISLYDLVSDLKGAPVPDNLGDRFERRRRADVMTRTMSVDLLNRSLLSDFLPVQMARAAGLHVLSALPPLRGLFMREGIEPGRGLSAIGEALRGKLRPQRS